MKSTNEMGINVITIPGPVDAQKMKSISLSREDFFELYDDREIFDYDVRDTQYMYGKGKMIFFMARKNKV